MLNPRIQLEMLRKADLSNLADAVEMAETLADVDRLDNHDYRHLMHLASQPPTSPPTPPKDGTSFKMPIAGEKLIDFFNSPIGEEVLEGVLMGTVATVPGLFQQDKDQRETALQWLGAVTGGIGLGIGARRIGAGIGAKLHPGELTDPSIASLVRLTGQERISTGISETLSDVGNQAARGLRSDAAHLIGADLRLMDDAAFTKAYPDLVKAGISPSAISPQEYDRLVNLESALGLHADKLRREAVERAVSLMDAKKADLDPETRAFVEKQGMTADNIRKIGLGDTEPVTGEHLGRAIGRLLGDEAGVLLGMGAGTMAATALGYQSSKDLELQRLRDQLAQQQKS